MLVTFSGIIMLPNLTEVKTGVSVFKKTFVVSTSVDDKSLHFE